MDSINENRLIFNIVKNNSPISAIKIRELAQEFNSSIWNIKNRSIERKIQRKLDLLVEFSIIKKEKIGKEIFYSLNENKTTNPTINTFYKERENLLNSLNHPAYYFDKKEEKISNKDKIVKILEDAIISEKYINLNYKGSIYKVAPLKILLFDNFWYLLTYNNKYYKYRIKHIKTVELLQDKYKFDEEINFKEWSSIFFNLKSKKTKVKLYIDKIAIDYFKDKNCLNINNNNINLIPCMDGYEYEIDISNEWELLPTLMKWQRHVSILESFGEIDIKKIYKNIL